MRLLASKNVACKRSRRQECSREEWLLASDSKPLKRFGGISVHRHDFDLVECNWGEVARESFDPLWIVMTHGDAFRQIENSVVSIFLFVACIANPIALVCL